MEKVVEKKLFFGVKRGLFIVSVLLGGLICFFGWFGEVFEVSEQDICLDDGGVWDSMEQRCRRDCLTFNDVDGCVVLGK